MVSTGRNMQLFIIQSLNTTHVTRVVFGYLPFSKFNIHTLLYIYIQPSSVTSQALTDLFRRLLTISPKVFQVVFIYLIQNSSLFLASCCCSFLIHVTANFTCIFVVSRQLVLLSTLQKFINSFCDQNCVHGCCSAKNSSRQVAIVFILFFMGPNFDVF